MLRVCTPSVTYGSAHLQRAFSIPLTIHSAYLPLGSQSTPANPVSRYPEFATPLS